MKTSRVPWCLSLQAACYERHAFGLADFALENRRVRPWANVHCSAANSYEFPFGPTEETMGCAAPNSLHWQDLRTRPREDILRQPGVRAGHDPGSFEVPFLNALYVVDSARELIRELSPHPSRRLSEHFQILLIRYLVANNGGEPTGENISEKDLPGGVTFFQGPHALQVGPIAQHYGTDAAAFEQRARELGGVPVPAGDKAFRFLPFPFMPVTYVLWRQDEEFPASVTVLFDKSIGRWFELDMIFMLVLALTERIMERGADQE